MAGVQRQRQWQAAAPAPLPWLRSNALQLQETFLTQLQGRTQLRSFKARNALTVQQHHGAQAGVQPA